MMPNWNINDFLEQMRQGFGPGQAKAAEADAQAQKSMAEVQKTEAMKAKQAKDDELHSLKVQNGQVSLVEKIMKLLGPDASKQPTAPTPTPEQSKLQKAQELFQLVKDSPTVNTDQWNKEFGDVMPWPTTQPAAPSNAPEVLGASAPPQQDNFMMDYQPYVEDPSKIAQYYPKGIPQPSAEQIARIRQISPNDATRSAILKLTESGFNDFPKDYTGNSNGTTDRGPNMINSGTFDWLQGSPKYEKTMKDNGITDYQQMTDPLKNEMMMDIIRKAQGYGAWFGPRDKGFNVLNQK